MELVLGARSLCNYLAQRVVHAACLSQRVVPHTTGFGSKAGVGVTYLSPAAASTGPRAVPVQGASFHNKLLKVASAVWRGQLAVKWAWEQQHGDV